MRRGCQPEARVDIIPLAPSRPIAHHEDQIMSNEFATLEVSQNGDITVIRFGDREVLDQINLAVSRSDASKPNIPLGMSRTPVISNASVFV